MIGKVFINAMKYPLRTHILGVMTRTQLLTTHTAVHWGCDETLKIGTNMQSSASQSVLCSPSSKLQTMEKLGL